MISFEFLLFLLTLEHWHTLRHPAHLFCFVARSRRFSVHRVSAEGDDYFYESQVLQGRHMRIYQHSSIRRQDQQGRCFTQACLYSYFLSASLDDAATFMDWLVTSFLIFHFRLSARSASSICLLAWRKFPGAFWWSALPPLPNQLVSYPSPRRD